MLEQNQLNRLQMVQFHIPKVRNPCVIHFWVIPFSPFSVLAPSFLPLSGVIRNWSGSDIREGTVRSVMKGQSVLFYH